MQLFSADTTTFLKQFNFFFGLWKHEKTAQFFQYILPIGPKKPKSQILFLKNCSSRDLCIMTLVAGGQSVALTKEEQDQYNGQPFPLSSVEILDISDSSSSKNWTTGFLFYSFIRNKYANKCFGWCIRHQNSSNFCQD